MSDRSRRIATLLALSAGDYSEFHGSDETRADDSPEHDPDVYLSLIAQHGGRCFSRVDDNVIAEFDNAVEALRCAVEIQQAMIGENKRLRLEKRVLLRIGLHIDDVREEDGTLRGEGVDVADGLRSLAVPGGISLSSSVYEHVKHRAKVSVEFAGEKKVKNFAEPVAIYQVAEPGVEKGHMSLWVELRRRNVFRVGVAYAVVAWLLIQVADVLLPTFDAPRWVMQLFVSVVILGFPVAVVLAWIYELTPVGLKRSDDVLRQASIHWLTGRRLDGAIISLLVVAVVFLVYENYVSKSIAELNAPAPVSVAVLAFENQSTDAEDEFFAEGLADELLSALARIHELKVASRTASFYFKDKDVDVSTIASTLMVDNILSGSVRREGERVRVTAHLDDTQTENLLWSRTYDRRLEAILDVQSDIAQSVAAAIVPVLSPESQDRIASQPTENAAAYQFYLRGRDYLRQPAEEATLASAIALFDRAIERDPRFAHAYAGRCEAHLGSYEFAKRPTSFETAEVACHRALTLDSGLWEVHLALGNLYNINGQYAKAILELETAIEQQPNSVDALLALAQTYADQGELSKAELTYRRAEEVESGYWGVYRAFGNFLYDQSRYEEAIQQHTKVTELAPDSGIGYDNLGNTYLAIGDLQRAESAFNASPLPSRWTYANRGLVYYYRGEFEKAVSDHRQAIELAPDVYSAWGHLADAYRFVDGEADNARKAYEKAIELAERELTINPTDWVSVGRLGVYYANMGKHDQARKRVEQLLRLTTDSTAFYFATLVSLQRGDLDRADDFLQQTIEGGWSRALLAGDPDLAALRGKPAYDLLIAGQEG